MLAKEGLDQVVCERLQLDTPQPDLTAWSSLVKQIKGANRHVQIALVGKYTQLHDAYLCGGIPVPRRDRQRRRRFHQMGGL